MRSRILSKWNLGVWIVFFILHSATFTKAQSGDSTSLMPPQVAGMLNFPKQFFFFDFTQNTWLNAPEGVETKFISGGMNISFLYEFNVISSHLGIAPGIGYSVTGVKSNSIFDYQFNNDYTEIVYTDLELYGDSGGITKSKLSVSYLEIPLEVHIHLKPNERGKSFLIAPGFRAGVKVGDFWKVKYHQTFPGYDKAKFYNIEHIEDFRYGLSLRLMYYKFGLYTYYQLNHLFEKGKGPEITPFSVGITVSPF
jgi:hypothetical protein